jgi:hypothetical protein
MKLSTTGKNNFIMKTTQKLGHVAVKNAIVSFVWVCLLFLDVKLQAFSNPDTLSRCLQIEGRVSHFDKSYRGNIKVELISNNKVVSALQLSDKHDFRFMLNKDTHYAIRISKPGHVSRIISIYTNLPEEDKGLHRFSFDTELIPVHKAQGLDKDALDFPIAVVSYDHELNDFYYNEEYTAHIKKQLYTGKFF